MWRTDSIFNETHFCLKEIRKLFQQHSLSWTPVAGHASDTTKGFLKLQNYILTHFGLILSALHQGSLVARRKESTSEKCISFMKQAGGLPYLNNSNKSFCPRWNWMGTKVHVASGLLERKSQTQWWSENIFQLQATMWDIFFSVFIFCTVFFTSTYMH